jgi:glycosyltransferase involved in cell wall biosynthesis
MKILLINTGYLSIPPKSSGPYAGGSIELHVYQLASELAKLGAEVYCVTNVTEGNSFFEGKVIIYEPKNLSLESQSYVGNLAIFAIKGILTSMEAAKVIIKQRFDIVHGHGNISLSFLPFLGKTKTVFTVHNRTPWMLPSFSFKQVIRKLTFIMFDYNIMKRVNSIIAVSGNLKEELVNRWKIPIEKITIIPNGVDLERFRPKIPDSASKISKYGINSDYALFVGRLVEEKGVHRIIEAIPGTDLHVVIIGDGPLLPFLRSLSVKFGVDKQVHFLGTIPRSELPNFYSQATLFILPSLAEGTPLAGLEAAASGLPLVVSSSSGMDSAVINGYNGFVVDEVDEIREKMTLLFRDKSLRRIMGERSRKIAEENFSWKTVAQRTLQLYEKVLHAS